MNINESIMFGPKSPVAIPSTEDTFPFEGDFTAEQIREIEAGVTPAQLSEIMREIREAYSEKRIPSEGGVRTPSPSTPAKKEAVSSPERDEAIRIMKEIEAEYSKDLSENKESMTERIRVKANEAPDQRVKNYLYNAYVHFRQKEN